MCSLGVDSCSRRRREGMEQASSLSWRPLISQQGTSALVFGVSIKVASCFQFVATVTTPHKDIAGVHLWHRPTGFVFEDPHGRGHIRLRWPDRPYSGSLIVRIRREGAPHATQR